MSGHLYICTSCDRYAEPAQEPTRGRSLAHAVQGRIAASGSDVPLRTIDCLDGCTRPCNAALRGRGRPWLQFSGLDAGDAEALLDAARRYRAGASDMIEVAGPLASKVFRRATGSGRE